MCLTKFLTDLFCVCVYSACVDLCTVLIDLCVSECAHVEYTALIYIALTWLCSVFSSGVYYLYTVCVFSSAHVCALIPQVI